MIAAQAEFQNIFSDFQPKIVRYLARLVGEEEAEDLAQETFIKVSQGLDSFRGESKLSTWIYRIATNTALDRLRSPTFRLNSQMIREDEPDIILAEDIAVRDWPSGETANPIERQCVKNEMSFCLLGYIQKLPENYRAVILLSDLEEIGNKEIAEILGVTLETIKIRLHRARAKLREELVTHCEFYWVEELSWRVI